MQLPPHFSIPPGRPNFQQVTSSRTALPDRTIGVGAGMQMASIASVQFGAALAAQLFSRIGPLGTVGLRLAGAAVLMVLLTRPWRHRWTRADLGASLTFGGVLAGMNTCLYLALDRLPLATVITIEFLGPLALAIVTATTWATRVWAIPAGAGVALLGGAMTRGGLSGADLAGVGFALVAAGCWAAYILLNGVIGRGGSGLSGLALATCVGAVIMLPVGIADAGTALWDPQILAVGAAVGLLSSTIPYSLDLLALRRLPTAVFGVVTSLNPGVAALAGFAVLGQVLPGRQLAGIALVMLASAGVTLTPTLIRRRPDEAPAGHRVQPLGQPDVPGP